jgi:N-acetylneuraminate lyase
MAQLSGIMPAVVTPFDESGAFAPRPFEKLLERLYGAGVDGLYVCGQTGEGLQQSVASRQAAAEAAVKLTPKGKTVIVHIGAHTTPDAITLARHAARCGAHAVSSLPPAGAYSFEEIKLYYQAVAAASDLPLLIYYFPSVAPALRTTEQMLDLCSIPNVVGLKFTDSDMFRLWSLKRSGAVIFNGSDEMLVAGLIMGADGGIGSTYNLMPAAFVALHRHTVAGDWTAARAVQSRINEFIAILLRYPVNPGVKAALRASGIDCGLCVAPRRSLTPAEEKDLLASLAAIELGRELFAAAAAK